MEDGVADITWLNLEGQLKARHDWSNDRAGAFGAMIHRSAGDEPGKFVIFVFNARANAETFHFPEQPGLVWKAVFDTVHPDSPGERTAAAGDNVGVSSRSLQVWVEAD